MALNIRYVITLLLLIFPIASFSVENNYIRVELNHVDSKSNFTQIELINRAATRTMHRLSRLTGKQLFSSKNISTTVHSFGVSLGEYFMDLAIGNPPVHYSAVVDTGSDLIWTQCAPCEQCVSQPTPIYDPSNSTTVSNIPSNLCANPLCSYNYTYGTGWTNGTLKEETFTFGATNTVQVPRILFGCSTSSSDDFNGTAGLVGFGRLYPLSLPQQLNTSMFSYCLSSFLDTNSTSTLFIGPMANFSGTTVKSTPFVKNPSSSSAHYYLPLQGISLGTTKLLIQPSTFSLQPNGTGGIIIDSGTTYTMLINDAYQAVENGIESIMNLKRVNASDALFDLCYYLPSNSSSLPTMPDMTLHFQGADMVLPVNNYMMAVDNQWCLAMSGSNSMSILGNYQQQNFHILYDIDNNVLSFSPAQCDKL